MGTRDRLRALALLALGAAGLAACRSDRASDLHGSEPIAWAEVPSDELPVVGITDGGPPMPVGELPPASADGTRPQPPSPELVRREVWRVGRPPAAGLPPVRMAQREDANAADRARIRAILESRPEARAVWFEELEGMLASERPAEDDLWSAAARVVGQLGFYALADRLAPGLDEGAWPGRVGAARSALHRLYGTWFADGESFAAFVAAHGDGEGAGPEPAGAQWLLERALATEDLARARLVELFELDPVRALEAPESLDPRTRAERARVLGEALTRGVLGREVVLGALFARLVKERDPGPYHAVVQALSKYLESEPFDSEDVVRLRRALLAAPRVEHSVSIAQALARMPWRVAGEPDESHLFHAIDALGMAIRGLSDAGLRGGRPDPDAMMEVLLALETLCDRATAAGLASQLRDHPVQGEIKGLLRDRDNPVVVRVAAAEALDPFAQPSDARMLIGVLSESGREPALGHALLGTLRTVLLDADVDTPGLGDILAVVVAQAGARDPDLRRRALALLADPALEPLVRIASPRFLVQRLAEEEVADLAKQLITLIGRFGSPQMLPECLATRRFDELAGDPASLSDLAKMCELLARGKPGPTSAAARRLAAVDREGTRIARLRHALRLIAGLDEEALAALTPETHRSVCAWAWEVHVAGTDLATAVPAGFLERLATVHWPRSEATVRASPTGRLFDEAARYHLIAVVLGLRCEGNGDTRRIQEAEEAYERALKVAGGHRGGGFEGGLLAEVRRDRARFRNGVGKWAGALEDFRYLAQRDALALPDVRTALRTLHLTSNMQDAKGGASETFDFLRSALARPTWPLEPAAVRMQDLRDLSNNAIRAADAGRHEVMVSLLGGLPDEPPASEAPAGPVPPAATAEPPAGPAPVWRGLVRNADWLQELRTMRVRHLQDLRTLRAASQPQGT